MFESVNRRMLDSHPLSSPGAYEEVSCCKSLRCCIYHTINAEMQIYEQDKFHAQLS